MNTNKNLSGFQIILMAVASGAAAANINISQPILKEISLSLRITENQAGLIPMLSQIGYGLGLFFITPLGDKVSRKKMILTIMSVLLIVLLIMITAVNIREVWLLSLLTGVFSVSPQFILPLAASLDPVSRGKTVGIIYSGLLTGILVSRVVAGFVGEWLGWRYVYAFSAGLTFIMWILLSINLPDSKSEFNGTYPKLLKSSLYQIKRFALLRQVSISGALLFGVFCSFWTTLTFYLSGPGFNFHPDKIGLLGIIAVAGPLLAPTFGRFADKGHAGQVLLVSAYAVIASLVLLIIMPNSVTVLGASVLLLNIGVPANQVTNVSLIYTLDHTSYSRINTVYMTSYMLGGSVGTLAGLVCWKYGGWNLVSWEMMACTVAALWIILKVVRIPFPAFPQLNRR